MATENNGEQLSANPWAPYTDLDSLARIRQLQEQKIPLDIILKRLREEGQQTRTFLLCPEA